MYSAGSGERNYPGSNVLVLERRADAGCSLQQPKVCKVWRFAKHGVSFGKLFCQKGTPIGGAHHVGVLWIAARPDGRQPLLMHGGAGRGHVLAVHPHLVRYLPRHLHVATTLKACTSRLGSCCQYSKKGGS